MNLKLEAAIISNLKARAILTAIDELFVGEWDKLGRKGELISSLNSVLGDCIRETDEALNEAETEE